MELGLYRHKTGLNVEVIGFCQVVSKIMNEAHNTATANAEQNFINRFKQLLNSK